MYRNRTLLMFVILMSGLRIASAPAQGKWKVLFDGKSTDAWRGFKQTDFPSKVWRIDNGVLKTEPADPADRVDIVTQEKFSDFELELEWKVSPRGNGGVLYRGDESLQETWHTAPEIQVQDNGRHLNTKTSAGSFYAIVAPSKNVVKPVGEFNLLRVVAKGSHVEHWLNGEKIVAYDLSSPEIKALISQSKFKDYTHFGQLKEGFIALQHHGQEVWYRNVRIRSLK